MDQPPTTGRIRLAGISAVAACVVFFSGTLPASQHAPFVGAVEAAYGHYRMAWFYSRTGSGDVALMELAQFQEKWAAITRRYRTTPPRKFAGDPRWRSSLDVITKALAAAAAEGEKGRLRAAHHTLSLVRGELSELRTRNGVVTFADLVEAGAGEVRALSDLRRRMGNGDTTLVARIRTHAARLKAAIIKVRDGAPARHRDDEGFRAAIAGNLKAIGLLERGLDGGGEKAIRGAISAIRSDFNLLFIRYG